MPPVGPVKRRDLMAGLRTLGMNHHLGRRTGSPAWGAHRLLVGHGLR